MTWTCRGVGESETQPIRNLFLFVGADPETTWVRPCKLRLDRAGFVLTGAGGARAPPRTSRPLEASLPGVFAIGDVRAGSVKRVGGAIGEGAAVVAAIHGALADRRGLSGLPERSALRGLLRVLARPVRTARGRHGVVLQPYRGYGSARRIFVIGRAFWQRTGDDPAEGELRDIVRRIRRRPVREARIRARFYGAETEVVTDRDGYFRVEMAPGGPVPTDRLWHRLELAMLAPERLETTAEVYIPPRARVVVVSDIDDTVMHTGVANKAAMLWRLFVQDAESRTVFPGVSVLYRALHAGASGDEGNPMLYVSRAPWGIYELLEEFFRTHDIPEGPILFLREWGLSWKHPVPAPRRRPQAAADRGDDGALRRHALRADRRQRPARPGGLPAHRRASRRPRPRRLHPRHRRPRPGALGRGHGDGRARSGRPAAHLVLAPDSLAIAEDAARLGLIAPEAVAAVGARVEERRRAGIDPPPPA